MLPFRFSIAGTIFQYILVVCGIGIFSFVLYLQSEEIFNIALPSILLLFFITTIFHIFGYIFTRALYPDIKKLEQPKLNSSLWHMFIVLTAGLSFSVFFYFYDLGKYNEVFFRLSRVDIQNLALSVVFFLLISGYIYKKYLKK